MWTTQAIQTVIPSSWDMALSVLSLVGSFEITTILVVGAGWLIRKNLKKLAIILVIYAGGMGIELAGKTFINHPGPPEVYHRYQLSFVFPSSGVQTGNSYPSGHSYRTVFLAVLAWPLIKKKEWRAVVMAYVFLMLVSRVSLGEHWASDVVGGGLLGIILGRIASRK
ncbi:MAG: hypothetical protein G01um101416_392 [Microgenomates group bacterium Gr01-1014_16]|nr:MAG: hypothetical protein G01um101416_392 [Microgenomates group bacterium Gr01-1014_16]